MFDNTSAIIFTQNSVYNVGKFYRNISKYVTGVIKFDKKRLQFVSLKMRFLKNSMLSFIILGKKFVAKHFFTI